MAKKSFIKGIDSILGNESEIREKQVNVAGKPVMKKQTKRASRIRSAEKTKAQTSHKNPADQIKVIHLKSKLTIDQSHALKEEMIAAYNHTRGIKLIAEECDTIDLSFIQLCYALYQTAQKENKEIEIEIPLNEEQTSLLKNTGIYYEVFTGETNNQLKINHNN